MITHCVVTMVKKMLFLSLLCWLLSATPLLASPDTTPRNLAITANNLETMADADAFAKHWVEDYLATTPNLDSPVSILHVGNELPEQLKWVLVHLDRAHIPYELKLLTKAEVDTALTEARDKGAELLSYDNNPLTAAKQTQNTWQKAKLIAKRVFGLPNGMTFWVKMKSNAHQRWIEAGSAAFQAAQAGVSLGVSMYLVEKSGVPVHIAPTVGLIVAWVAANTFYMRPIVEVLTQGRIVKETKPGEFKAQSSRLFFYMTSALRSFVLNGLIVGTAFGWDQVLTSKSLHNNLENTALSLVAGSWVEQYINSRQARTGPDGKAILEPGKWSPAKTIVINTVWGTFYYGLVRNLHLLNYGSFGKWTYYVMAAVGSVYTIFQERLWFAGKARQLLRAIGVLKVQHCESIILRPGI